MASYQQTIRRGLPRIAGGPGWPDVEGAVVASGAAVVRDPGPGVTLRRGLPRVAGGEPWPAAGEAVVTGAVPTQAVAAPTSLPVVETASAAVAASVSESLPVDTTPTASVASSAPAAVQTTSEEVKLRRGLPRIAGGDPWPSAETATVQRVVAAQREVSSQQEAPAISAGQDPAPASVLAAETRVDPAPATAPRVTESADQAASAPQLAETPAAVATTPAAAPTVPKAASPAKPAREPRMLGSRSLSQWVKLGVWGAIGAILAAGIIVLAARGVTTLPGVPEFVEKYPGEYHIPEVAEPGFPAWARWTHFLNFFLMMLIVRSGLQVRQQQKPPAFWTPKKGGKKISINLWLHTSLDVLWMLNGVVFVVLLFASGHWARIIPTSWEVFPNAASALLQYLTLEWPVENGWVNYNSLQQIMYFLVVFVAAPLAIATGLRMSEWWPEKAETLNRVYPAPLARAIHFPTMLFFVLFILIHVFLVFTTGALRNLNHMFAGTDDINWVGFWWFAAGLFVTVSAVFLAKPLVLAPIASLTGKVSNR